MASKKDRRHRGWVEADYTIKGEDPVVFYDDWIDYRDGMRGYDDHKKIQSEQCYFSEWFEIPRWNKKNKLLLKRRLAMKTGRSACVI